MDLDRIDVAILEHLQKNGRATTLELSEAAGLSPSPCHRRQRLLEEAGVIQRYVALLDQERVGLPVSVFVTVELAEHSDQSLQRFETAVADCPEIMECYEMTGTSDYLLRVVCADLGSYEQFIRRLLAKIGSVRAIRSAFALKRVVYRTNLPLRRPAR
ncbi:MAG TPA: Lrp/AsnC family transcriptional regulator [Acidisphaera sp.]|nr:Lrp/AsnC family transcriptional regulator [Acidisphaera sp.]